MKLLAIALSGARVGCRGEMRGAIQPIYNKSLFEIVTVNAPAQ
jgi:hypothetical protein